MKSDNIKRLTYGAMIAALYALLTWLCNLIGIARFGIRISEALCILPVFLPEAIPGLFVGCLVSNLISGAAWVDILFGSLATLLAAYLTRKLRRNKFLAVLPPIIINSIVIPLILVYAYNQPYMLSLITVLVGETVSAGILGIILYPVFSSLLQAPYRGD